MYCQIFLIFAIFLIIQITLTNAINSGANDASSLSRSSTEPVVYWYGPQSIGNLGGATFRIFGQFLNLPKIMVGQELCKPLINDVHEEYATCVIPPVSLLNANTDVYTADVTITVDGKKVNYINNGINLVQSKITLTYSKHLLTDVSSQWTTQEGTAGDTLHFMMNSKKMKNTQKSNDDINMLSLTADSSFTRTSDLASRSTEHPFHQ